MLNVSHLNFAYKKGKPVLRDVSVALEPGFTVLVGKNGCGKSTLMNLITGALPCREGSITIDGAPVASRGYTDRIAFVPQVFEPYTNLSVREVLTFVAGLKGVANADIKAAVATAAERTNVSDYLSMRFGKCSEGTKRRVGIATALLGDRSMVMMDEPTAGLDPAERARFYDTVKTCFAGKTVMISTHILEDMETLADHVVMVSGGRVVYTGAYAQFAHALDNRVYAVTVPSSEQAELHWLRQQQDGLFIKGKAVFSGEPPAAYAPQATTFDSDDIWNFFERGYYDDETVAAAH